MYLVKRWDESNFTFIWVECVFRKMF